MKNSVKYKHQTTMTDQLLHLRGKNNVKESLLKINYSLNIIIIIISIEIFM